MASGGGSVSKRLTFFGHGLQTTFQRAGSVISSSLRSCDDASEVFGAGNEFLVNRGQPTNGAESLSRRLGAAAEEEGLRAKIWGDHRFKLSMKWLAPDGKRPGDRESVCGSVLVQGFVEGRKTEIPLRIVWQRKCADQIFPITFTGNSFPITADDVACCIRVQATSAQSDLGTAFGELGPFDIDAAMRKTLQDFMHNGGSTFPVELVESKDMSNSTALDADEKSYTLQVTASEVKLTKPGPKNVGFLRSYKASTSAHQKIVDIDLGHNAGLKLHLKNEEGPTTVRVAALSRRQRDTIVLIIRAFQAVQVAEMFGLLEQVALNTQVKDADFDADGSRRTRLDFYLIFDQLNRQTLEALALAAAATKEKNRAVVERDALEQDINATIEMYQRLLTEAQSEDKNTSSKAVTQEITQRAALIADLQTQVRETQNQAKKYLEELELSRRDYRDLKSRYEEKERQLKAWVEAPVSKTSFTDNNQMRLIELEGQLRNLEQLKLNESMDLRRELNESKTAGNRRVQELESKIKRLESQVQQLEFDKDEAQQNFLYIKEKHDKLELEKKAEAYASIENSDQVQRAEREARREMEVQQTRIRDLELQLEDYSRRLETLTAEEIQLRRENDSLNKHLDQLRNGAGHQTQMLIDMNRSLLMTRGGANATEPDDSVRAKLATAEHECARLRAKNEELERKLRKLAAA